MPLRPDDRGPAVRDLHRRLRHAGYVVDDDPDIFGARTCDAVTRFQQARGLIADGICGPQTWASLVEAGHQLGSRNLYLRAPMMRGDDVAELQRRLGAMGFDAGRVDGIFGPDTANAVAEFQRNTALTVDSIAGRDTVAALARLASRAGTDTDTLASVRERERLIQAAGRASRAAVVGDLGGAATLAEAVGRALTAQGVEVAVLRHPDGSVQARASNEFGADLYLGLTVVEGPELEASYFAVEGFESHGGQHLAQLLLQTLDQRFPGDPASPTGRRLPALRETKMPAVVCRLGPAATVVAGGRELAAEVSGALVAWFDQPLESP